MYCQSRTRPTVIFLFIGARQAARIVLGKFEVILREECLWTDISLLMPYLEAVEAAAEMSRYAPHRKQRVYTPAASPPCCLRTTYLFVLTPFRG